MNEKGKYVYDWPRPMVTVDAVVFAVSDNSIKLLLINRGHEPFKGQRELKEETGLTGIELEQMHTFGKVGRDPRGRQITVCYLGIITEGLDRIKAGDDAAKARWFDINALPPNMAFDHSEVARFAIERLKSKLSSR
jgi:8-oxo-dGTP diphosphatase